jgi:hypothetical protein
VSLFLVLVGLAVGSTWPGMMLARLVGRGERVAGLLGARRLQSDPASSGRVVATFALLVFFGGVVHALLPTVAVGDPTNIAPQMRTNALLISFADVRSTRLTSALTGVQGVTAVVPFSLVNLGGIGTVQTVDCRLLRRVVTASLPHCSTSTAYVAHDAGRIPVGPGDIRTVAPLIGRNHHLHVRLPNHFETMGLGVPNFGSFILPPSSLPHRMRRKLIADEAMVATDGRPSTAERVRNALARLDPRPVALTFDEANGRAEEKSLQVGAGIDLAILVALAVALANLLVVTVDHIQERRRPFAFLAASGVSLGVLKRSVAVEIGVPLLGALCTAAIVAIVVAALLGAIANVPVSLPAGQLASLGVLAIASVGLATALTFPFLSRATQSATIQFE